MTIKKTYNVLVLDKQNSVMSIMAEALFNSMGDGVYRAYSAGVTPLGIVNRFALEEVRSINYPINSLRSKSFQEFSVLDAPKMNFVITLDNLPHDMLPEWLEGAIKAHWQVEDPTKIIGSFEEKREGFKNTFLEIQNKIDLFTQLPLAHLNQDKLDIEMEKWKTKPSADSLT